jgi:hypothetical protein
MLDNDGQQPRQDHGDFAVEDFDDYRAGLGFDGGLVVLVILRVFGLFRIGHFTLEQFAHFSIFEGVF